MSKKNLLTNPYRAGDENHLYFNDEKILKLFASSLTFLDLYFRYEVVGMKNIPEKGPALLVGNHGFFPFDLVLLSKHIYEKMGRRVRVLVHERSWRIPMLREIALNIGVVNAKPENAIRLLKQGEIVAVFPGGEREGMKPSSQKYQLLWDNHIGFARTAIAAKAPVIPCMSVGIDDIFHVFERSGIFNTRLFHRYFPFPFFLGLGGFPIPRKITQHIGLPINFHQKASSKIRKGTLVKRLHAQTWKEAEHLLKKGLEQRKWWE